MTTVLLDFDAYARVGSAAGEGFVLAAPARPKYGDTAITVTAPVTIALDRDGTATRDFDPTAAGEGVQLTVKVNGFPPGPYIVAIPDQASIAFTELLKEHLLDPDTLDKDLDALAAWDATLAQVQALADQVHANTVTARADPDDPGVLDLTFPTDASADDGTAVILTIGA